MINVKIDENVLLDMLMERVGYWTSDDITYKLFEIYYRESIENGLFEGLTIDIMDILTIDIMDIVDNDYVNYTAVLTPEEFEVQYNSSTNILATLKEDNKTYLLVSTC